MTVEYKAGETVQLRCYEALKRQYGVAEHEKLEIDGVNMEIGGRYILLGSIVTISRSDNGYFTIEEDEHGNWFPLSIIAHNFKYGELIDVSFEKKYWYKEQIFVGYIDGAEYPYIVVPKSGIENFKSGKTFRYHNYTYARKLQQPELIKVGDICFNKAEFEEATKNLRQYKGE